MWFLLFRFLWARRWRAEGCSWSAVPRVFALSAVLAKIRATEPCKYPGTDGWDGSAGEPAASQRRILHTVAPQSELPRAVTAFLSQTGCSWKCKHIIRLHRANASIAASIFASGELVLLFKLARLDLSPTSTTVQGRTPVILPCSITPTRRPIFAHQRCA